MPTLGWGLTHAVPHDATAAWGARLIIDMAGRVDFVPGRTDFFGDEAFLRELDAAFPPAVLADRIRSGLADGEFTTRTSDDVVLFDTDTMTVVANPNGSAGYLYVAAYRKGET